MPATDSPAIIVARFLKANNYTESYDAFIAEAGLPPDAGMISKGDLTLEVLLEEKRNFDLQTQFEKLGVDGEEGGGWRKPAPEKADVITALPTSSNILTTAVLDVASDDDIGALLLASTADRRLHVLDAGSMTLKSSLSALQDSPILSIALLRQRYLMTASMSGQLIVSDVEGNIIEKRRDHAKYIVKIAQYDEAGELLCATAGWDCKVVVYKPSTDAGRPSLGEPVATITLPTKPEAMIFLRHPESNKPILLISRTDSSFLYYYTVSEPRLLGRQNLAPHSNAWVAFTPSALAICPTNPELLAVGTSSVPHMKLLIVRLLVPPYEQEASTTQQPTRLRASLLDDVPGATETQASQARRELAIADRESTAIQIHCTTMAPQTAYSTPAVAWRPDGSGVWVNGDDGAIRGVEASSGKVLVSLLGHDVGSKVRCLWAGAANGEEWLVSGGFDQRLIVWKAGGV